MATRVNSVLPPLLALLVSGVAAPAAAQRVDYRISGTTTSHGVVNLGVGTSVAVAASESQTDAVFTSDGQFAVSSGAGQIRIHHVPTAMQTTVPVDFRPVLAHPRQPMLFGYTGVFELARLDGRGMTRLAPCPGVPTVTAFDVALDGEQVFVACASGEIVVLDTASGLEVRRLTGMPAAVRFLTVNAAGELIVSRTNGGTNEVARLDAQTGQVIASRPTLGNWSRTGSRRQLMEYNCPGPVGLCVYQLVDSATLALSRALPGGTPFFARVFVSPDGREVVFNDAGFAYAPSRAVRLDVATGAVLNDVVMDAGDTITVNYVPVPLPPESPTAVVAGNTVTLSWQLPVESPQASRYRAEIGTTPGATDLGVLPMGSGQTFTVPGVPPGRYYVRLRAVNYTGTSAPSADVLIDVP